MATLHCKKVPKSSLYSYPKQKKLLALHCISYDKALFLHYLPSIVYNYILTRQALCSAHLFTGLVTSDSSLISNQSLTNQRTASITNGSISRIEPNAYNIHYLTIESLFPTY